MTVLAETTDPDGRRVVLDDTAWAHITDEHGELEQHQPAMLMAISAPQHRAADPRPGRERYWLRDRGPSRWLLVVVDFNVEPARVVTAFGNRKDPPGWVS